MINLGNISLFSGLKYPVFGVLFNKIIPVITRINNYKHVHLDRDIFNVIICTNFFRGLYKGTKNDQLFTQ